MTITTTSSGITVLTADEGKSITNGTVYATEARLGASDSADNWRDCATPEYDEEGEIIVKTYSKLKLLAALKRLGVWDSVKAWMVEQDLYEYWLAAQDLSDGNDQFNAAKAAVQTLVGMTDAETDALLAACVADSEANAIEAAKAEAARLAAEAEAATNIVEGAESSAPETDNNNTNTEE